MSMFQGKDNIFDAVKGYILDTTEGVDGNQDLLDLYNWRESGKLPDGASQELKNMIRNFEELGSGGKDLGNIGKKMKSDRLEMMKKYLDIGKNSKVTISTNKGALQL